MEEEANGGRCRDRGFFELLGGDGADELLNLRARFCIVIDRKLAWGAFGLGGNGYRIGGVYGYKENDEETSENQGRRRRRSWRKDRHDCEVCL